MGKKALPKRNMSVPKGLADLTSIEGNLVKATRSNVEVADSDDVNYLPLSVVIPRDSQSRRHFDEQTIHDLSKSIREYGVLQPIIVRPLQNGTYEIVGGERRYRAAELVGLKNISVTIKTLSELQSWEIGLVENLQREDLNSLDRVDAVLKLISLDLDLPEEKIPSLLYKLENERKGKVARKSVGDVSRQKVDERFTIIGIKLSSFVSHELPLLKAPGPILAALRAGKIDAKSAREIKKIKNDRQQAHILKLAANENLSGKELKAKIKHLLNPLASEKKLAGEGPPSAIERKWRQLKQAPVWNDTEVLQAVSTLFDQILNGDRIEIREML